MKEFKGIDIIHHVNDGIGFCINEEDGDTFMGSYFYLLKNFDKNNQDLYYLYNPMYTTFKFDDFDDV
jgi:hypothetical protein